MNIDCMGDLQAWSLEPNGALTDERQVPFPSPDPISLSIGDNCWRRAESIAAEIIGQVQPTVVSEQRRKAVIGCVQRLIRNCLGCEVFPFGSVPLKTYLPDGDIDLTAFGNGAFGEDTLAKDVFSVLEAEDKNPASEFVVKDVQYIRAEVSYTSSLMFFLGLLLLDLIYHFTTLDSFLCFFFNIVYCVSSIALNFFFSFSFFCPTLTILDFLADILLFYLYVSYT